MLAKPYQLKPWNAVVALAAGDSSKTLKAAPGANKHLVITKWSYRSTTSSANAITLSDGTTNIDKIAASITVGNLVESPDLEVGIELAANTALTATPASAGPAGIFIVEGYIKDTAL